MRDALRRMVARPGINPDYAKALLTGYGLMAVNIVVQLVLVPLYLGHLGKPKFGVLTMIMAATNYAAIGVGWMAGGLARILAEHAATDDRVAFRAAYALSKTLFVGYALAAVAVCWLLAVNFYLVDELDHDTLWALILASAYMVLSYEYNADRQALMARHWQARNNVFEASGQLVFAVVVGAGLYAGLGLPGIFMGQIIGLLTTRWLAWRFWRTDSYQLKWRWPTRESRVLMRRIMGQMGVGYVLYGMLLLTLQADQLFLGWIGGPDVAASYYLLWRIPDVVILMLWRIPGSYGPHFIAMDARNEHERLKQNYKRGLRSMALLALCAAALYASVGPWLVGLWVGKNAPQGHLPYVLAAAAMFFVAVARWPIGAAYALLNTRPLVRIAFVELTAKTALLLVLFDQLGYMTPALAMSATYAFGVFYLYLWLGNNTCHQVVSRHRNQSSAMP